MLGQDVHNNQQPTITSISTSALFMWIRMAFMWIYPNLIQPLFNEFKSLQDASLKEKIEALAAEAIRRKAECQSFEALGPKKNPGVASREVVFKDLGQQNEMIDRCLPKKLCNCVTAFVVRSLESLYDIEDCAAMLKFCRWASPWPSSFRSTAPNDLGLARHIGFVDVSDEITRVMRKAWHNWHFTTLESPPQSLQAQQCIFLWLLEVRLWTKKGRPCYVDS